MADQQVELTGLDSYSGRDFVLYFSDETYAVVSSTELADCFPHREPISNLELQSDKGLLAD